MQTLGMISGGLAQQAIRCGLHARWDGHASPETTHQVPGRRALPGVDMTDDDDVQMGLHAHTLPQRRLPRLAGLKNAVLQGVSVCSPSPCPWLLSLYEPAAAASTG